MMVCYFDVFVILSVIMQRADATLADLTVFLVFFFFNDTATTEIYTLSLHDALPISPADVGFRRGSGMRRCSIHAGGFNAAGLQAHRNPLRQARAKLPGLCLPHRRAGTVDLMSPDP